MLTEDIDATSTVCKEKTKINPPPPARTLVFQCLEVQHLPRVCYWRLRGARVYAQETRCIPARVLNGLGVRLLEVGARPPIQKVRLKLVQSVFRLLLEETPHVVWCRRLFGSKDIDHAFLQRIAGMLEGLFATVEGMVRTGIAQEGTITLSGCSQFATRFVKLVQSGRLPAQASEEIEAAHLAVIKCFRVIGPSRCVGLFQLFAEVGYAWIFVLRRLRWMLHPREGFRVAIRTYLSDWSLDRGRAKRLRNVDFVVDNKELRPQETIFWLEDNIHQDPDRIQELANRGYRYAFPSHLPFDRKFAFNRALPALMAFTNYRFSIDLREMFESQTCRWLWKHYLLSHVFAEYFRPRSLLVYNEVSCRSTARNIALRSRGCASVFYPHSCNWEVDAATGQWRPHTWFAFMWYDVLAAWNELQLDYFRGCGAKFNATLTLGCLWSEHARSVQDDVRIKAYYTHQIERDAGIKLADFQRIVGVFDTSISSMLSADDLYAFVKGTLDLAREMPDVLFLYKPKNSLVEAEAGEIPLLEVFGPRGELLLECMQETPNLAILSQFHETACVIALADLTLSASFTSTTVEAIGCGKRAIYYDPTNRMPHAFWRRIPDMVCVTGEELYERLRYLLWECSDEAYMDYLRTYCKGIENHFDGKAISRLRQYLVALA